MVLPARERARRRTATTSIASRSAAAQLQRVTAFKGMRASSRCRRTAASSRCCIPAPTCRRSSPCVDVAGGAARASSPTRARPSTRRCDWLAPEIVAGAVDAQRRQPIYAKFYRPKRFRRRRRNIRPCCSCTAPATCRTCTSGWPYYFREQMFHNLLTAARLRRARHGLPRLAKATAATGAPRSTARWAIRNWRTCSTACTGWRQNAHVDPDARRRLRRLLRRLHDADGAVPRARTCSRPAPRCVRSPTGRSTTTNTPPTSSTTRRSTRWPTSDHRRSSSPTACKDHAADRARHDRRQRAVRGLGAPVPDA